MESQLTTKKELDNGSEILKTLKDQRDELERAREEFKIEDLYNAKCKEVKQAEENVRQEMQKLKEGYGCIQEALAGTKAFRDARAKAMS